MFDNTNNYYKNTVNQLPVVQLLPTKLVLSYTFMYELKEYHNQIWLQIVSKESCGVLGSKFA